ncbi:hypothetical protein V8E36_006498 [Tilletia maclaganii]
MSVGTELDLRPAVAVQQGNIELVERSANCTFLTWPEIRLLIITGVGFLMDAYDLFVINMIVPILLLAYYPEGQRNIPWGLDGGVLKASANVGNIVGQIVFGLLGDTLGRSYVYWKELVVVIIAVVLMISVPSTPHFSPNAITAWIAAFRFLIGIGTGGDLTTSATLISDRARLKTRGLLLALIFSCQGLGNLLGGAMAVMVVAAYRQEVEVRNVHKLDGAWRILQGLSLIPALGVLYHRITLSESSRFRQAGQLQDDDAPQVASQLPSTIADKEAEIPSRPTLEYSRMSAFRHSEARLWFSEWRHLRLLFGTCMTWLLVDITFYGVALNQSAILSAIGFTTGTTWGTLMKTATGNLIITAAGFLPGYWVTVGLVEVIGRRRIQLIGFGVNTVCFAILAVHLRRLQSNSAGFFVVFVILQLFFNFGANSTTFIIAAETFPTPYRSTACGLSAASGKIGAIIASLGFAALTDANSIGNQGVFWIFTAVSILGFLITLQFTVETKGRDADLVDREEMALKAAIA